MDLVAEKAGTFVPVLFFAQKINFCENNNSILYLEKIFKRKSNKALIKFQKKSYMNIQYKTCVSVDELNGVLSLQQANLTKNLSSKEIEEDGFVTIEHTFELIERLNQREQHIIAKEGGNVIGYTLSMTKDSRREIPIIFPMFEVFDRIIYRGQTISSFNYLVVGQVCVDKNYRGEGVFDHLYQYYKTHHKNKYTFAITEIAVSNKRSLHAHKRIGFEEIYHYTDQDGTEWAVVVWDWEI